MVSFSVCHTPLQTRWYALSITGVSSYRHVDIQSQIHIQTFRGQKQKACPQRALRGEKTIL